VAVVWNKVRCIEYVRYGVMLNVMLCNLRRGVKCGDVMWNDGVVHGEYGGVCCDARCEMWLWNTE